MLRGKLEPAELYHEVLEHRWFLSEDAGREVPIDDAASSYMREVLSKLPDEQIALASETTMLGLANPFDPSQGFADDSYTKPYDPWEDDEADSADDVAASPAAEYLDISALRSRTSKGDLPGN